MKILECRHLLKILRGQNGSQIGHTHSHVFLTKEDRSYEPLHRLVRDMRDIVDLILPLCNAGDVLHSGCCVVLFGDKWWEFDVLKVSSWHCMKQIYGCLPEFYKTAFSNFLFWRPQKAFFRWLLFASIWKQENNTEHF